MLRQYPPEGIAGKVVEGKESRRRHQTACDATTTTLQRPFAASSIDRELHDNGGGDRVYFGGLEREGAQQMMEGGG